MIYKTVLVDDEPLAIKRLKRLLNKYGDKIDIIGEAGDGQEAVEIINKLNPDLVFLDIQMPELNGFEVIEKLNNEPIIIFTTAFDNYAIKAFEVNSTDYLLKPIEKDRLAKSIDKLESSKPDDFNYKEQISSFIQMYSKDRISRITVKVGDTIKFIDLDAVAYFQASDKYVELYTAEGKSYLINDSLNSLLNKIDPQKFKRVHRSYVVNLDFIDEITNGFNGKKIIKLKGPEKVKIPASKSYKENLNIF